MFTWLNFKPTEKILYIGSADDKIPQSLLNKGMSVFCGQAAGVKELAKKEDGAYDIAIAVFVLETEKNPVAFLESIRMLLNPEGRLILGCDNRLAIRYFCGDRDPYTGRSFDGIENYRRAATKKSDTFSGRCYDKSGIEEMLDAAGFNERKFYSCMPYADSPSLVFSEDYLPNEELSIRYFPIYHYPESVFLEEEFLYDGFIKNGLFHKLANNFIIECGPKDKLSDVLHVTSSHDRSPEDALYTIIKDDGTVEKRGIYPEGLKRLQEIESNTRALESRGIKTVKGKVKDGALIMPFVEWESANIYLQNLFFEDRDKFIQKMDEFRELILNSSSHIDPPKDWHTSERIRKCTPRQSEDPQEAKRRKSGVSREGEVPDIKEAGVWLSKGYFDFVPLNAFFDGNDFVFYDQEFAIDTYPANAIITRMIIIVYAGNFAMERQLQKEFFFDRYGLTPQLDLWHRYSNRFLEELRNEKQFRSFNEKYRVDKTVVSTNRQRMNYSADEYQRMFVDIFNGIEGKKLFLFGSGDFTRRFLSRFWEDYEIEAVLDNNTKNQDRTIGEVADEAPVPSGLTDTARTIPICSPDVLKNLNPKEYKVIICIKSYLSVMKQLKDMGVVNLAIFDAYVDYPRTKPLQIKTTENQDEKKKPYNIGYVAGVFDLFHMGHLNLLRRAKEQCNYLIVGIVSDEGVRRNKKTDPVVSFEERRAIVEACRYVDEAVEIPLTDGSSREAYRRYHFDAQFSGSDYVNDPNWEATKTYLEKHGAELVFFPYTESVSSTDRKVEIRERNNKESKGQ